MRSGVEAQSFPSTHWTEVLQAADTDAGKESLAALNNLLLRYREPLLIFLNRKFGLSHHQSEDFLHGFVAEKIIGQNVLEYSRRERGRFRNFLLTALSNWTANLIRQGKAKKRLPSGGLFSMETISETPESDSRFTLHFDTVFAVKVLESACRSMKDHCLSSKQDLTWFLFSRRVLKPLFLGVKPISYDDLIVETQSVSPDQAANLLVNAKRMFWAHLRKVVSEYCITKQEVEMEIEDLKEILVQAQNQGGILFESNLDFLDG